MKAFKDWIIAHKLLSIVIAAVIVVGAATAIVLPIALKHEHTFTTEWSHDGENHWHVCTGKDCKEISEKAAHVFDGEAAAACSVCGATRTLPTRYQAKDEAEWNAAFDFKSLTHFSLTANFGDASGVIVRDGDVMRFVSYQTIENATVTKADYYYVKDGETYYRVEWVDGSDQIYERTSLDKDDYEAWLGYVKKLALGECNYADFSYDEATHKYSNESATSIHTITFVGGAISMIEATVKNLNESRPDLAVTTTVTFEETALTVPAFHVFVKTWASDAENHWHACTDEGCKVIKDKAAHTFVNKNDTTQYWRECSVCGYKVYTSISAARYENALNFKDEDGKFYNNIDIVFINGTTKVYQYTVTEKAAYKYSTASGAENLQTIWTNENGWGIIYTKKNADSKWVRTESMEPFEDLASCVLPVSGINKYIDELPFGDITYSETDQMYHGSYKQLSVKVDVSMKFENGKLVELTYENSSGSAGTRTVTYGNAVIEIPNTDEVEKNIFSVPYDSEENNFTVNARLSEGDNWFMIEITSEMLGTATSSDIQVTFSVREGDTLPTLTIAAENKSGTAITNDSETNGTGYFEGLTAGKYYIKITTAEFCVGTLSVIFP